MVSSRDFQFEDVVFARLWKRVVWRSSFRVGQGLCRSSCEHFPVSQYEGETMAGDGRCTVHKWGP